MAYQPNIPQAANLISNSQGDILGNFTALGTALNYTAGGFNQVPFHTATAPAIGAEVGIEFAKLGSTGSVLFAAAAIPWFVNAVSSYPLMADLIKAGATADYTFHIGEMIVNCGYTPLAVANSYTMTFKTPYVAANRVLFVTSQPIGVQTNANGYATNFTNATITVNFAVNTGPGQNLYYLTIGY